MVLGLKRGRVVLMDHERAWEEYALLLMGQLREILKGTALSIQHVGSTSIPAIKAKPIIDIVLGVHSLPGLLPLEERLKEKGFLYRGEEEEGNSLYVVQDKKDGDIVLTHIHAVDYPSKTFADYVLFRDRLCSDASLAREYERRKIDLAERYENERKAYTKAKASFINAVLERR